MFYNFSVQEKYKNFIFTMKSNFKRKEISSED